MSMRRVFICKEEGENLWTGGGKKRMGEAQIDIGEDERLETDRLGMLSDPHPGGHTPQPESQWPRIYFSRFRVSWQLSPRFFTGVQTPQHYVRNIKAFY